jgi:hypothetical protein
LRTKPPNAGEGKASPTSLCRYLNNEQITLARLTTSSTRYRSTYHYACYGIMSRMGAQSAPGFDIRSSLLCLLNGPAFGFHVRLRLFAASLEHIPDEEVVDDGSHHAADQRSHYRNPEVAVNTR